MILPGNPGVPPLLSPRQKKFGRKIAGLPRPLRLNEAMNFWLVKSEPAAYGWAQFVKDGKTAWTGVRNYQARINLRTMKKGDSVCFYHSVTEKQIVGLARVAREAYPDPTAAEGDWSCVDLEPVQPMARPVSLEAIKADPALREMKLLKQSRLSVTPLTPAEFGRLLVLGGTKV